jgi:uncharacterized protein (TIGR02246 family)
MPAMSAFTFADEFAVRATLARYCHACDDGDLEALVDLFTPDAVFTFGKYTAQGADGLRTFFGATSGSPEQRGKHLTTNIVVTPGDGTARVASDFLFLSFVDGVLVPGLTGRYDDELVRVDGAWLFARRDVRRLSPPK